MRSIYYWGLLGHHDKQYGQCWRAQHIVLTLCLSLPNAHINYVLGKRLIGVRGTAEQNKMIVMFSEERFASLSGNKSHHCYLIPLPSQLDFNSATAELKNFQLRMAESRDAGQITIFILSLNTTSVIPDKSDFIGRLFGNPDNNFQRMGGECHRC